MTTIGHFRRDAEGFTGRLHTLALDAALRLVPAARNSAKAPDYIVQIGEAECGAAWKAGEASGALLNLKLDDPSLAEPINARLLPAEDGVLPLVWIRRVEPAVASASAAPPPSTGPS